MAMLGMRREDAVERLDSVLRSFRAVPLEVGRELLTIGASAGVAQHDRDGLGFEALYRLADGALRVAKASGRGRVLPAGAHLPRDAGEPAAGTVDDGQALAERVRDCLTGAGFRCLVLPDGPPAPDGSGPARPAVVVLDTAPRAGAQARSPVVVVTTGDPR